MFKKDKENEGKPHSHKCRNKEVGKDRSNSHDKKDKIHSKEKNEKIAEYEDRILRLQADFDNYKKQLDREKREFCMRAEGDLIKDLLPALDSFDLALLELEKKDKENFMGIALVEKGILKVLESRGLRKIEALGKSFDPYYHEVMMQEERKDAADGQIIEEFQKGYMLNENVLRHSKVKIARNTKKEETEDKK